ncbi:C1GALT1 family protein [Megaselia abdita]
MLSEGQYFIYLALLLMVLFSGSPEAQTTDPTVTLPRVLCWVTTFPTNHNTKAKAVKFTWGRRCDKILFMSSRADPNIDVTVLPVPDGRCNLWAKTKIALKYIYDQFLDEFDWFLKADDDTYVIMENLKFLLKCHKPEDPVYFGCKFIRYNQVYNSGGAGYVMSREALKIFIEKMLPNNALCAQGTSGWEDFNLGRCLTNGNVTVGDSRDEQGRGRFFPLVPELHLIPLPPTSWYWTHIYYRSKDGSESLSDQPISFHYVSFARMYEMEYLLYNVKLNLPGQYPTK